MITLATGTGQRRRNVKHTTAPKGHKLRNLEQEESSLEKFRARKAKGDGKRRMVGGFKAPIERAPWTVIVQHATQGTGAILNEEWIITVAHSLHEDNADPLRKGKGK